MADKTRLCPICRMEISIFATKCRYCGTALGRPKDQTRRLSVEDLGGEKTTSYAPSSSVMDAFEAFRHEEGLDSDSQGGGSDSGSGEEAKSGYIAEGLPELDESSRDLAQTEGAVARGDVTVGPIARPWWRSPLGILFILAIVGIGGYFGAPAVKRMLREKQPEQQEEEVVILPNPALRILERDENALLEALEAAVAAKRKQDVPQNQAILDDIRKRIQEKVGGSLNAEQWTYALCEEAYECARTAVEKDPTSELLMETLEEASEDKFAYMMVPVALERSSREGEGKVTFSLSPNWKKGKTLDLKAGSITLAVGGTIGDRFKVLSIGSDSVKVRDLLRKRTLSFNQMTYPKQVKDSAEA